MNETINTLVNRRSIRKYKKLQIKDEELNLIIEAGKYAPSGMGQEARLFVAIQDKETIEKITKLNAKIMGKDHSDPYYGAPTIILVFGDKNRGTAVEDASLALGNMYNAAASLGLASCWIHREKEMFETTEGQDLMKEWGVPDNYFGVGSCILGYADCEMPKARERRSGSVIVIK